MEIEKLSEKLIWVYEHGPFDDKVLRTRVLSTPNLMEFEPAQFFLLMSTSTHKHCLEDSRWKK